MKNPLLTKIKKQEIIADNKHDYIKHQKSKKWFQKRGGFGKGVCQFQQHLQSYTHMIIQNAKTTTFRGILAIGYRTF